MVNGCDLAIVYQMARVIGKPSGSGGARIVPDNVKRFNVSNEYRSRVPSASRSKTPHRNVSRRRTVSYRYIGLSVQSGKLRRLGGDVDYAVI